MTFKNLYNRIDDEKWFFMVHDGELYILVCGDEEGNDSKEPEPEETAPYRTTQHKRNINKVMFLCAQARPRQYPRTNDGSNRHPHKKKNMEVLGIRAMYTCQDTPQPLQF